MNRADAFTHDLLLDVLLSAERRWWLKRADQFLAARPVPGEFHGRATPEQLNARWRRLTEIARACRNRASVSLMQDGNDIEIVAALREAS